MRTEWVQTCHAFAARTADFYSGCRKIITAQRVEFESWENDLSIRDCGFTPTKLTMLKRLYLHEESHTVAQQLWAARVKKGRYGSVGFTTYNHFIKNDPTKKAKRASVMGPCIQSITLTLMNDRSVVVDAFYRTTELLKKFPADLVFMRDVLLPPFNVKPDAVRFHFANVTVHPMYWVTLVPLQKDPVAEFERFRNMDRRFYDWTVKWTARYLIDEYMHGIEKFSQAMRVRKDALERIPKPMLSKLQAYLKKNHPGYTRTRFPHDEEEGDDE